MVGLLAYVAGTSINNAINLDRAPSLINATALPAAKFGNYLQAERAAAVVYLFQPTPANLAAYQAAIAATDQAKPAFVAAMTSQATTGTETADGAKAISTSSAASASSRPCARRSRRGPSARWTRSTDYSQGIAAPARAVPDPDQERDTNASWARPSG